MRMSNMIPLDGRTGTLIMQVAVGLIQVETMMVVLFQDGVHLLEAVVDSVRVYRY